MVGGLPPRVDLGALARPVSVAHPHAHAPMLPPCYLGAGWGRGELWVGVVGGGWGAPLARARVFSFFERERTYVATPFGRISGPPRLQLCLGWGPPASCLPHKCLWHWVVRRVCRGRSCAWWASRGQCFSPWPQRVGCARPSACLARALTHILAWVVGSRGGWLALPSSPLVPCAYHVL
jgi:hypothetical protein